MAAPSGRRFISLLLRRAAAMIESTSGGVVFACTDHVCSSIPPNSFVECETSASGLPAWRASLWLFRLHIHTCTCTSTPFMPNGLGLLRPIFPATCRRFLVQLMYAQSTLRDMLGCQGVGPRSMRSWWKFLAPDRPAGRSPTHARGVFPAPSGARHDQVPVRGVSRAPRSCTRTYPTTAPSRCGGDVGPRSRTVLPQAAGAPV